MTYLIQITTPYLCAGLELDQGGRVIKAAPILGYMARERWPLSRVMRYCDKMRWAYSYLGKSDG